MSECPTCGSAPCANPSFCRLCRDADRRKKRAPEDLARLRRLMSDDVSLERARHEINRAARERYNEAPQPTVEALMYSLRERGTKALEEPATKRRLSDLSDNQVVEVGNRLPRLKPHIARAWSAQEVEALFQIRTRK